MRILKPRSDPLIASNNSHSGYSEDSNYVSFCPRVQLIKEPHRTAIDADGEESIVETPDGPMLVTSKLNSRQRMRRRVKGRKNVAGEDATLPGTAEPAFKRQRLLNTTEVDEFNHHKEIEELLIKAREDLLEGGIERLVDDGLASGDADGNEPNEFISWPSIVQQNPEITESSILDVKDLENAVDAASLVNRPCTNPSTSARLIETNHPARTFIVPPSSTFLQSDLTSPCFTEFIASVPPLDLVLLDPPWPNRSAARKGEYDLMSRWEASAESLSSAFSSLKDRLSERGVVGVWVTNRPAHRKAAVEFVESLGLNVFAEWVWGKVTPDGSWTVPLNTGIGNGRRPYEVMLLARRSSVKSVDYQRQVVFAVPTQEHSRKPHGWNELVAEAFGAVTKLELFARELKAAWWSWGNEPLKFQDLAWWNIKST